MNSSKHPVLSNPCPEKWENMRPNENGRQCQKCSTTLEDLSKKSLFEISERFLNKGKCVKLNEDLASYFRFHKSIKRGIIISSLFIGMSIINVTQAQTNSSSISDSCIVTGKLVYKRSPKKNHRIIITVDSVTYEAKTNNKGEFIIVLPKNSTIEYSNVIDITKLNIADKDKLNLRKVKYKFPIISCGSF